MHSHTYNENIDKSISERYDFIDLLKVIAILFVLMYHATNYSSNFLKVGEFVIYLRYFMRTILSTCVPIFFLANGFLLMNKKFDLKKHIIKSIRMVILTFIWGAIDLLLLSIIENSPLSIGEFINALWSWKLSWINHLWYMGALIYIYVFFPLIKVAYDNNKKQYFYFVIITAIFTFGNKMLNMLFSIITGRQFELNWFNMFNPFRSVYGYVLVYFCVGGCLSFILKKINDYRIKSNIISIIAITISMLSLFGVGIIMSRNNNSIWDVVWDGYDTIFTFVNVIAIFVLTTNYNSRNKILHNIILTISKNTLGIYFIHVIFIHWMKPYVVNIGILSNIGGNILFSLVVLILSLFTTLLIKKLPLIKNIL